MRWDLRFATLMAAVLVLASALSWGQAPGRGGDWNLSSPQSRAQVVKRLKDRSEKARAEAWQRAKVEGWSPKGTFGGRDYELQSIVGNRIYMFTTANLNAGISTAANMVRNTAPYNLNGTNVTVGEWDSGNALTNHQELVGRITRKDLASASAHSTHVAGTIGATGVSGAAIGMAPSVRIDSYEWNNDISEMASRGMTTAGEAGKLQLSNHSYAYLCGWETGNWSGSSGPHWLATWGNREADGFGIYDVSAVDVDTVSFNCQYYLPFIASANNRDDAAPANGTTFYYLDSNSMWVSKSYVASTDPFSDGWKNGGYDTLPYMCVAKNAMVVGAVDDAVFGGIRSLPNAVMAGFSGWGPTDDGRVKPDVVGNGVAVFSSVSASTSSYDTYWGTSMATPNVCGSAALLLDEYNRLFPSAFMRASTIKALIIHTADDLGAAGPDYQYGWGLMNTKAAADLLIRHHDYPAVGCLAESFLSTGIMIRTNAITWDGSNAIRATISWTDPPGEAQTALNSTNRNLVNDLDLRIMGPLGEMYYPYVLTPTNPAAAAKKGDNNLDNVEQVYISAPSNAGLYRVTVGIDGSLTGSTQYYSMVISGSVEPTVALAVTGTPFNVSTATPVYGSNIYHWGTSIVASVVSPCVSSDGSNTVTWACTGWVGTGSVPAGGSGTDTGELSLWTDSRINWQWVITDLVLSNQTVGVSTNFEARDTVTAGDGFIVTPSGRVTLKAGRNIRLAPGFAAATGSYMRASISTN